MHMKKILLSNHRIYFFVVLRIVIMTKQKLTFVNKGYVWAQHFLELES